MMAGVGGRCGRTNDEDGLALIALLLPRHIPVRLRQLRPLKHNTRRSENAASEKDRLQAVGADRDGRQVIRAVARRHHDAPRAQPPAGDLEQAVRRSLDQRALGDFEAELHRVLEEGGVEGREVIRHLLALPAPAGWCQRRRGRKAGRGACKIAYGKSLLEKFLNGSSVPVRIPELSAPVPQ